MPVHDPSTTHADHDELLMAAFAAGDLRGAELAAATELVASCPGCAALATDLGLIRAAIAGLPTPRRTRDFRLTEADAARLRPAGWRRFLVPFGGPRLAFTQPMAAGLATLGIVGILLSALPTSLPTASSGAYVAPEMAVPGSPGARNQAPLAASPPADGGAAGAASAAPSAAPSLPAAAPLPAATSEAGAALQESPAAGGGGLESLRTASSEPARAGSDAGGRSPLLIASVLLVVGGVGLLLLRWSARRLTGP